MTMTTGAFPYDVATLLGGACRILYGEVGNGTDAGTVAVPDSIADIISMTSPYTAAGNWKELGATSDSFTYSRGFESEGYEIQQVPGNILEEITSVTRTISVSAAQFNGEILKLIENAPGIESVAAATGASAQDAIPFGTFASARRYRFAFIAQRMLGTGDIVTEPGSPGLKRGTFVCGVLHNAQVSADDAQVEIGKGTLAAAGVSFTAFPEPSLAAEDSHGVWLVEKPGTITGP